MHRPRLESRTQTVIVFGLLWSFTLFTMTVQAEPIPDGPMEAIELLRELSASDWQSIQTAFERSRHNVHRSEDRTVAGSINPVIQQAAYIKASNTDLSDEFGFSVAVSGDTVVVGALNEDSDATGVDGDQDNANAPAAGAAYVFVRDSSGGWSQQAYLKASNTNATDQFGRSVAISGDTIVVGAIDEDGNTTGVDGDQSNNDASDAGAAYVFVRDGSGAWSQQAYLKASNTDMIDYFGWSVAVSGDTVVVGASGEDSDATGIDGDQNNNDAPSAGAAYVFTRDDTGVWSQQAYLKASNTTAHDGFGKSVAVSGDTVVVGAQLESSNATGVDGDQENTDATSAGAAYVFVRNQTGVWSQQAYLKASNTNADDQFGNSVAISGDTVLVGAFNEASNSTGVDGSQESNSADGAGAAYVFVRDGLETWSQEAYLKASNTDSGDKFGSSTSISGDNVLVGAYLEESNASGVDGNQDNDSAALAGAAYLFSRDGSGAWSQQAYVKPTNTDEGDRFGFSVAVSEGIVAIAAFREASNAIGIDGDQDDNSAPGAGAAYVFAAPRFTVGGIVTGLEADQVVLQNNGTDEQVITTNTNFYFSPQDNGTAYEVTVAKQPNDPSQTCDVINGSGTLTDADVEDVEVICSGPEIFTDRFEPGVISQ